LAHRLPIEVGYDEPLTILSLVIAIALSAFALRIVSGKTLPLPRLINAALWMGFGIVAMHYTGMAAMSMSPGISYDTLWLILSMVIAFIASFIALWMSFSLRKTSRKIKRIRLLAAVVMGVAIAGMHYSGMYAASFATNSICLSVNGVTPEWMAIVVIIITVAVSTIALLTALLDVKFERYSKKMYLANQELRQLVLYDHLTNLPNRSLLADRMGQAILKSQRSHQNFALLFLDLDDFKEVNTTYSYEVGDQLIQEVARRLESAVRAQDTVARFGSDEFILLIDLCTRREAAAIAEKLLQAVEQPYVIASQVINITASIGIAYYPEDGMDAHTLLAHANLAMYRAKHEGVTAYAFYEVADEGVS
jgi:diguanylate cyclase (GGDEF)-like protein